MSQQFFEAIRAGDREKVDALLSADATLLAAKDEKGLGAYVAAKYSGRNDIATMLVEKGVELDVFAACMAGAKDRVLKLIRENPALVSAYSHDGWTPLHLACFFGQPGVAEVLMAQGADVGARSHNPMQNTPLHAAAAGRSKDAVRALLTSYHRIDASQTDSGLWLEATAARQFRTSGDDIAANREAVLQRGRAQVR